MEKIAYIILLCVLIWSPLAFGAVYLQAQAVMSLGVFAASLLLAIHSVGTNVKSGARQLKIPATGLNLIFLLFLFYLVFQLIPLPDFLLKLLSPEAWIVAQKSLPASQSVEGQSLSGGFHSISSYSGPVRQSLILWITYGLFFFSFARVLNTRKRIDATVLAILILGCFETLYGMGQTFTGSNHIWWFAKTAYLEDVTGTYVNRNHFAGLMAMIMMLGVLHSAALSEKRKKRAESFHRKRHLRARIADRLSGEQRFNKRNFVLFAGAVTGMGLIFSASRGGMISAAAGLLLTGILLVLKQSHRRKGFVVLSLFLIISVYAVAIGVEKPLSRFDTFYASMEERERFWEQTLDLCQDYPLAGVGIGGFQYAYPKYQAAEDTRHFIEFAHNDWIQFLAEGGILGFVLLFAGIGYYIFQSIRIWRSRHDGFAVCLGILPFAVLAAIGIHSWSDFNLHLPANFLMLAAMLAIGHTAVHLPSPRHVSHTLTQHRFVPLKYTGFVLLALFAVAIGWSSIWAFRSGVAEAFYYSSQRADSNLSSKETARRLESASAWDPSNAQYLHELVKVLQKVRYEEPAKLEQEHKRGLGDPQMIEILQSAIRLNPLHDEPHIRLAWECTYLWDDPDSKEKWIPAADLSMERAAFFAGENNPFVHFWMGDYWLMRSKTVSSASSDWEAMLAKSKWHFQKNLALETGSDRKRMLEQIKRNVWMHYPDLEFIKRMVEE